MTEPRPPRTVDDPDMAATIARLYDERQRADHIHAVANKALCDEITQLTKDRDEVVRHLRLLVAEVRYRRSSVDDRVLVDDLMRRLPVIAEQLEAGS